MPLASKAKFESAFRANAKVESLVVTTRRRPSREEGQPLAESGGQLVLTADGLAEAIQSLGIVLSPVAFACLFREIKPDGSGNVNLNEVCLHASNTHLSSSQRTKL